MGKLIDPKLGDYVDRYTILALKTQHTNETGLIAESDAIQRLVPWIDMRLALVVRITMVNTLLWVATDEFDKAISDALATCDDRIVARLAMKLRRLNRRRAELVAELSGLDEAAKEETDG
jgi:hypothetical protein